MSLAFALEKELAVSAVLRACRLTSSVFNTLVKDSERLTKGDKSPVTVGDFGAQAVVNTMLASAFPEDKIVGEENADELRQPSNTTLRERVVSLANETIAAELSHGDNAQWGIGPGKQRTAEELLDAIDLGNSEGGRTGRMWTLDPIDGTLGFLRGEQYAVCLAFVQDAQVQVGVMGCPNLPIDYRQPDGPKGCLFVAVRGQGAEQRTISNAQPTRITIPTPLEESDISVLESVEPAHSALDFNARVAQLLNISRPPTRMDSQAKYCSLARGHGSVYIRMPRNPQYKEKIWDHAAGSLLVEEAGGLVTDSLGRPLDFGLGRTLGSNYGIVAAGKEFHSKVLAAIQKAKEDEAATESKI